MDRLAVEGGRPVRAALLSYGHQMIDDDDVQAVTETLRSAWLTTGPKVEEFEKAFAASVGVAHAVAVTNGTAALHASMAALLIGRFKRLQHASGEAHHDWRRRNDHDRQSRVCAEPPSVSQSRNRQRSPAAGACRVVVLRNGRARV